MNLHFIQVSKSFGVEQNLNKTAFDWLFTSNQGVVLVKDSIMVIVAEAFRVYSSKLYLFFCHSNRNLSIQSSFPKS